MTPNDHLSTSVFDSWYDMFVFMLCCSFYELCCFTCRLRPVYIAQGCFSVSLSIVWSDLWVNLLERALLGGDDQLIKHIWLAASWLLLTLFSPVEAVTMYLVFHRTAENPVYSCRVLSLFVPPISLSHAHSFIAFQYNITVQMISIWKVFLLFFYLRLVRFSKLILKWKTTAWTCLI